MVRAEEVCDSRGGRPGLPVPNSRYGFCGRKTASEEAEEEVCSQPTDDDDELMLNVLRCHETY